MLGRFAGVMRLWETRFFFSSRRRHTISYGDWSAGVCSSDLPFDALRARMALRCFAVAIGPLRFSELIPPIKHIWRGFASRVAVILGVWSRADHRSSFLRDRKSVV